MIYEFQATQDLHGWGKPWAPGANVNLFGGVYGTKWILDIPLHIENGDSFTFSADVPEAGNPRINLYTGATAATRTYQGGLNTLIDNRKARSVTFSAEPEEGTDITGILFDAATTDHCQVERGTTASPFSPYANVCMPEGFNIWNPIEQEFIQVYAGYVNANTRELYLRPVYQDYAGEELVGPWMSSLDPYDEDTTPTEGAFVIDFGGELESFEITPFMLQTLLDSLGIRQHFTDGAGLLNKLMDQAQGRVRSEEELLHLSRPLNVIAIGDQLPAGISFKPISKDVLPGLPGKFIR